MAANTVFAGVAYVIRSVSEGEAFWSNTDGWGGLNGATRFSTRERMEFRLPASSGCDSEWMLLDEAQALQGSGQSEEVI